MNLNGKPTNPGELRTKIALKTPVIVTEDGFQKTTYSHVADIWAKWVNVHGSEVWASQAINATEPATVTIRYSSAVKVGCAVDKDGKLYRIISVDDIQNRHEYMELKVTRIEVLP